MNDPVNYKNNPLHGLGLKDLLIEIVDHYGFDILDAYLNINCFKTNPSIASSLKFLKKTDWAREKVESFYLYQFKNLPRATDEQFQLPPRDRIIPDSQVPGEPAKLSLEDAQRLQEKRARRASSRERGSDTRSRSDRPKRTAVPDRNNEADSATPDQTEKPAINPTDGSAKDPWAKWR